MNAVLAWLSILIMQLAAPASAPATLPQADRPGVYLITMGPGDAPWEKFGHVMLRIYEPAKKIDVSFNWGMFDFEQKNFIWNFIQGRLWYWMDYIETDRILDFYLKLDRTIWVQELNLSDQQRQNLLELCALNSKEDQKFYKYDYYLDNCSTRVRDKLDEIGVLNGQIRRSAATMPSGVTFRSETSRLMSGDPIIYTALYFILGQPIDRKLSAWDEMFIPMRMRERFNQMTIVDASGHQMPLVLGETILHISKRPPLPAAPPNWLGWYLFAGIALGGAMAWFARKLSPSPGTPGEGRGEGSAVANRKSQIANPKNPHPNPLPEYRARGLSKWSFIGFSLFWSFLAGFGGWFLLYGWFLTDHTAVRPNENILQLSPLLFPLIVLIPKALRGRERAAKIARWLSGLALALSIIGLICKVLPMMDQVNFNMIALAVPSNAGLFWGVWRISAANKGV
jgi:Domain of unknown function (DUF4105)